MIPVGIKTKRNGTEIENLDLLGNISLVRYLKTVDNLAKEVIRDDWGNGEERKRELAEAGYDYHKVQNRVNELI